MLRAHKIEMRYFLYVLCVGANSRKNKFSHKRLLLRRSRNRRRSGSHDPSISSSADELSIAVTSEVEA